MDLERISKLRHLDVDDLLIGSMLLDNSDRKDIHKFLSLTPPAITHRLNKVEAIFGSIFDGNPKITANINEDGYILFTLFKQALLLLLDE